MVSPKETRHVLTVVRACSVCLCGFTAQKQPPKLMAPQSRAVHFPDHGGWLRDGHVLQKDLNNIHRDLDNIVSSVTTSHDHPPPLPLLTKEAAHTTQEWGPVVKGGLNQREWETGSIFTVHAVTNWAVHKHTTQDSASGAKGREKSEIANRCSV